MNPIGISTWAWTSPLTTRQAQTLIPKVKEMGFDVIEIPLEDPALLDCTRVRRWIDDSGLDVTVAGVFGPDRDLSSSDPAVFANTMQYLKEALDACRKLGSRILAGPVYAAVGKARSLEPEERQAEFELAVHRLKPAASMAEGEGVMLALEPLNRFETDMVNTAAQVRKMVEEVDHSSVGILLDMFHMNIEENSILQAVLTAGELLLHVHASECHRGTPGEGTAAWEQLRDGIGQIGYRGPVVIETFTPEVKTIARAASIWRPLAPSQDALAQNGLRFLRHLLGEQEAAK